MILLNNSMETIEYVRLDWPKRFHPAELDINEICIHQLSIDTHPFTMGGLLMAHAWEDAR